MNDLEYIEYPSVRFRRKRGVVSDIDLLLADLRGRVDKGIHLGAGSLRIPGLLNCDLYNPDADIKADATKLDMFEDSSVDWIESHHMIEHLSFEDTDKALSEWYRVLRVKGFLVFTFPDLTAICKRWIKYSWTYPFFPKPEKQDYIIKMLVGSQEHDGMFHRNAFDIRLVTRMLSNHGFKIEFTYHPYQLRETPSRLVIARKLG